MAQVTSALDSFPGIFRKSANVQATDIGRRPTYTLHARYARRRRRSSPTTLVESTTPLSDPVPEQSGLGEELDVDTLRTLLDFVLEQTRLELEARHAAVNQRWVLIAAVIAAAGGLISTSLQLFAS
jgi:hypothetical protein